MDGQKHLHKRATPPPPTAHTSIDQSLEAVGTPTTVNDIRKQKKQNAQRQAQAHS